MNEPKAYDIPTFCRVYSIGRTLVYKEIKEGRLPFLKIGRRTLISKDTADNWFQSLGAR